MSVLLEEHLLGLVLFLPAATAIGLLLISAVIGSVIRSKRLPAPLWRGVGLLASTATFGLAVLGLHARFDPEHIGPQLSEHAAWLPTLGVNYFIGLDGINLYLVLLTTGLVPILIVSSWNQIDRSPRSFVFYLLILESGLIGVFVSLNLLLFFFAWQATLIPMFFLIGVWGGSRRVRAATRFLVFGAFGSTCMLASILALLQLAQQAGGLPSFDLVAAPGHGQPGLLETTIAIGARGGPWWSESVWLFAGFALACGVMLPIVPLHAWLPDAQSEAPVATTALLAGVGLLMGAYGLIRFALPLFPTSAIELVPFFFWVALIGIVYGSLLAAVQADLKRLVGWWSIAHLGFVLLGIFSLDVHGLTGGVVAMISHGLTVSALFVLIGFVVERRGASEIAAFGGLARPMPVFASLLGITLLSAMGMPAFSGFVGDFLVVLGSFGVDTGVGLIACAGWLIAASALAWTFGRVALGPVANPENRGLIDLGWRERLVVIALIGPMLGLGLYPNPVLRRIEPSVLELMRQMDERRIVLPIATPGTAREETERDDAARPGALS